MYRWKGRDNMAQEYVIMPAEDYQAACDAVRAKTGGIEAIKSGDLASEIGRIAGEGELVDKEITENGVYVATNEGVPGYSRVVVSVPTDAVMKPLRAEENGKVYLPEDYDADGFYSVFVNVPTGDDAGATLQNMAVTVSGTKTAISIGLPQEPKMFSLVSTHNYSTSSAPGPVLNVVYDGTTTHGLYMVRGGYSPSYSYTATYSTSAITWSYSNGTLIISASGANFNGGTYQLTYI